jgi:phage terminase small subunit
MPVLTNLRWEKFCLAYVYGPTAGNGRASYRAAGYNATPHSASAEAHHLMKKPEVQTRIAELQAQVAQDDAETTARTVARLGLDKNVVLAELSNIALANMLDCFHFDDSGKVTLNLAWIERSKAAGIVDVTMAMAPDGSVSRIRIKLADKRAALADLGRFFGMFADRQQVEEQLDPATEAELERRIAEEVRKIAEARIAQAEANFFGAGQPPN